MSLNKWTRLRYKAFKKCGNRCQLCGVGPDQDILHVDHIKSKSLYPALEFDLDNLQILCSLCNLGKANIDETDWRNGWEDTYENL